MDTPDTVGVAVIVALVAVKSTIVTPDPIMVPPEEIPIAAERPGAAPVKYEPSPY